MISLQVMKIPPINFSTHVIGVVHATKIRTTKISTTKICTPEYNPLYGIVLQYQ